jgi:hypothetical protein
MAYEEYKKEYYKKHKDIIKKRASDYQKVNKKRALEYQKEYQKNNKEKIKEYRKKYRRKCKDKINMAVRKYHLVYKYGITVDEYNKIFEKQKGCCAICGKHQNECKRILGVDHNHITGKVRGLLCTSCNQLLGFAQEDIKILKNSVDYLIENQQ